MKYWIRLASADIIIVDDETLECYTVTPRELIDSIKSRDKYAELYEDVEYVHYADGTKGNLLKLLNTESINSIFISRSENARNFYHGQPKRLVLSELVGKKSWRASVFQYRFEDFQVFYRFNSKEVIIWTKEFTYFIGIDLYDVDAIMREDGYYVLYIDEERLVIDGDIRSARSIGLSCRIERDADLTVIKRKVLLR